MGVYAGVRVCVCMFAYVCVCVLVYALVCVRVLVYVKVLLKGFPGDRLGSLWPPRGALGPPLGILWAPRVPFWTPWDTPFAHFGPPWSMKKKTKNEKNIFKDIRL